MLARTRVGPLLAAVAAAAMLAGCSSGSGGSGDGLDNGLQGSGTGAAKSGGHPQVVAAENMWGNVAAQLAGSAVSVTSIIDSPDEDPHEYESTVDDAALVAHARLVIRNGAGYDTFIDKLISADSPAQRKVLTVATVVGAKGDNVNPHLWYQPSYVSAAARAIANDLARIVPSAAATFQRNLANLLAGEQQVTDVIAQIRAKYAGKKVAYTEPVAGYLVKDAGLKLGIPVSYTRAIEEGTDPSPLDDATFKHALSAHQVSVLLYNSQVADSTTEDLKKLATQAGIPIVGVTETLPPSQPNLQTWQATQARELLAALGG
ncbi:MAG TPA: zinc ABC transporter substrate-binding protein [Jatrophihabitantaceae bacterium]|nr:zinc ABC transporter substrate-binding protein [Jatrophihabitantaceae bacterium]